jgi:predicted nucleic acid-binding protein
VIEYLLDTNVVSELRKQERAHTNVRRWFDDRPNGEVWLSVLVVGELHRGVELVSRRDAESGGVLGAWLDSVLVDYGDRILPVTIGVARRWATLSFPDPVPVIDGLLAATAIEHGLTLVTRNVAHLARTGVALVDPFEPSR